MAKSPESKIAAPVFESSTDDSSADGSDSEPEPTPPAANGSASKSDAESDSSSSDSEMAAPAANGGKKRRLDDGDGEARPQKGISARFLQAMEKDDEKKKEAERRASAYSLEAAEEWVFGEEGMKILSAEDASMLKKEWNDLLKEELKIAARRADLNRKKYDLVRAALN